VLQLWLDQSPDFGEVSRWYLGWKEAIGSRAPALLQHDGVRERLNVALDMLNTALSVAEPSGRGAADMAVAPPPPEEEEPPPPPDEDEDEGPAAVAPSLSGSRWGGDDEPTLRETLERLAGAHDLVFMPLALRHEGKQVFTFGKTLLYLDPDKELVYAKLDKRGYATTSLAQLVAANQS